MTKITHSDLRQPVRSLRKLFSRPSPHETGHLITTETRLEKWRARDYSELQYVVSSSGSVFEHIMRKWRSAGDRAYLENLKPLGSAPYEIAISHGNAFLNVGINNLWNVLCGNSGAVNYSGTNARIGVGSDSTAAVATQTGLLGGATTLFKPMDASYPQSGSNQQAVFQSTFVAGEATFTWAEWVIDNGISSLATLNRRADATLGTKAASDVWSFRVTLTLA